jgi:hypothetical protein
VLSQSAAAALARGATHAPVNAAAMPAMTRAAKRVRRRGDVGLRDRMMLFVPFGTLGQNP